MAISSNFLPIHQDLNEWTDESHLRSYLGKAYQQVRSIHNQILHALYDSNFILVLALRVELGTYEQLYVLIVRRMQALGIMEKGVAWEAENETS